LVWAKSGDSIEQQIAYGLRASAITRVGGHSLIICEIAHAYCGFFWMIHCPSFHPSGGVVTLRKFVSSIHPKMPGCCMRERFRTVLPHRQDPVIITVRNLIIVHDRWAPAARNPRAAASKLC
jgi:hypothetical protein